jgi:predicted RNA polymerase sigma factor
VFQAALGDILRRMIGFREAVEACRRALALETNLIEQEFLK